MSTSEEIFSLVKPYVEEGKILPRDIEEIEKNINDYVLIKEMDKLVACAGLKTCSNKNMGEIYSLAVNQNNLNQGLSLKLLDLLIQSAKDRNIRQVFALTKFGKKWFIDHGFIEKTIESLPKDRQKKYDHQRKSSIFFLNVN